MGIADEIGSILKQYQGGNTPQPADVSAVNAHFDQVASAVPQTALADGVAHALRSDQTPPLGQVVSSLFSNADGAQKAGMINHLLASIGPAAATTAAGGALASVLGKGSTTVTPQQAQQLSPATVSQLADHAESADGSVIDKLGSFYAQHPTLVKGLGATALALMMSRMSNRR
jgi:hypothetical protein